MSNQTQTFTGATTWVVHQDGSYFTTLATNLGINVRFYKGGSQLSQGQVTGLLSGLEIDYTKQAGYDGQSAFNRVEIDVLGADTVNILISDGAIRYNRSQGSVSVTNNGGAGTQTTASVTNANAILDAANATRRRGTVQNNSTTAVLRLTFDGSNATPTHGFRIQPGGMQELSGYMTTGGIRGCMETADATAGNVEILVA